MIRASVAKHMGMKISSTTQSAVQADGKTPFTIIGEIHVLISLKDYFLKLDALIIEGLDYDLLAGIPFQKDDTHV